MTETKEQFFSIFCEAKAYDKPLIMTGLTFSRLIDDIVLPFEEGKPFFIDGAPITKEKIGRLKIIKQGEHFDQDIEELHYQIRRSPQKKIFAEQYHIRLEDILRCSGEDVTAQVIKAYDATIKPKLRDYLPKRQELIDAALKVFLQALQMLGSS
jgi:hypothetical protein